jgi:hypothetical protein
MYYYYTDGKTGPLVSKGYTSETKAEGIDTSGWYLRIGEPPANYTTKASEFDVWNTQTLQWDKNPEQSLLEATQAQELQQQKEQQQKFELLAERRAKLVATDWTQLPDVPLETKQAWAEYRQALRDITSQPGYPTNVVWPTPP